MNHSIHHQTASTLLGVVGRFLTLLALLNSLATHAGSPQILTWVSPLNPVLRLNVAFPLEATVNTGLPVTFRVVNGPAFIENGSLTATNVGTIQLEAEQAGNLNYARRRVLKPFNQTTVRTARIGGIKTNWNAENVQVVGNLAYVANGLRGLSILDITHPETVQWIGGYATNDWFYNLQVVASRAYLVTENHLRVLDVGKSAAVVELGSFYATNMALGVHIVGTLAYVANGTIEILDVSNPAAIVRVGGYKTTTHASSVRVLDNLAYVTVGTGLHVLDVSNPAAIIRLGSYDAPLAGIEVEVIGNLAYLTNDQGLEVLDVSNPGMIVRIGGFNTAGTARRIRIKGNLAYVAEWSEGLEILDVSNPAAIVRVGSYKTTGGATGVDGAEDILYVTDSGAGLQVLHMKEGIPQDMNFAPPAGVSGGQTSIPLEADASSGLPVSFNVLSGPGILEGNNRTISGLNEVVVRAEQLGDVQFFPVLQDRVIAAIPTLELFRPGSLAQLGFAWPEAANGFSLEQSSNLLPDSWTPVQTKPSIVDGNKTVTISPIEAPLFFRLRKP